MTLEAAAIVRVPVPAVPSQRSRVTPPPARIESVPEDCPVVNVTMLPTARVADGIVHECAEAEA